MSEPELVPVVDDHVPINDEVFSDIQLLLGQHPTKETGTPLVVKPRRSARTTAGQQSNVHRLPQSVQITKPAA